MPPKSKSKKAKSKKVPVVEIDWASDENFRPNEPVVYAELDTKCFVFREQFDLFMAKLQEQFPQTTFRTVINSPAYLGELGPREGAFEISIAQNARCPQEPMWSGVGAGPPRRMKFSGNGYEDLWPAIRKIVNRIYVAKEKMTEDEATDGEIV